jgi:flagellar biosynthetic protein FliP
MTNPNLQLLNHLIDQALKGPGVGLTLAVAGVVLSVAAFLLMTSFTRIVVVLSFVRTAVGVPTAPPNMVIIALALVITLITMAPTFSAINRAALTPYATGHLTLLAAVIRAGGPMRAFLLKGTTQPSLGILYHALGQPFPKSARDIPFLYLVLGFSLSQLTQAFQMAVMLYIPFLIIDLVTASVLMSLGMMMLPPTVVSLPIKLLLFVAVNGWGLVVGSLLTGAHF